MQRKTEGYREHGRAMVVIAVAGAFIAGAMLVQGCGGGSDSGRQAALATPVQSSETPATPPVVTPAEAVRPMVASTHGTEGSADSSLPPDVEVAVADTVVTPGEPVTIVVHATSDATRIELKTETGDVLPMLKDESGKNWRVTYRVPLRPAHERWGVSITARNDANRWRRVWVFMHAQGESDPLSTGTDGVAAGTDSTRTPVK
jgi:hypothetical protein